MKKLFLIFIVVLLGSSNIILAAKRTSVMSGDFDNPATWGGTLPAAGDDITIDAAHVVTVTSSSGIVYGDVTLQNKLIINSGQTIEFGIFDFSGTSNILDIYGTIKVASIKITANTNTVNVYSGGVLTVTPGGVVMNGTGQAFTIANAGSVTVAGNVTVGNNNTVTVSGTLSIAGTLTNNGTVTVPAGGILSAGLYSGTLPVSSGGTIIWPLPIELSFFIAINSDNTIKLTWQTASEENNHYFTIERSADGISFEPIATITGAGNSSSALNYSYIDKTPLTGTSYYQLKQTDYDGQSETFDPVSVTHFNEKTIHLSPVPTSDILNVTVDGSMGNASLKIINMLGAVVRNINQLENQSSIDVSTLPKGIYILSIEGGSARFVKQVMIK